MSEKIEYLYGLIHGFVMNLERMERDISSDLGCRNLLFDLRNIPLCRFYLMLPILISPSVGRFHASH